MTDDFHQLKGTDILFYGYESVTKQVWTNMGRLLDLLDLIGTNPSETVVNPTLKTEWHRDKHFSYDHIILVGHSLGGVLCREALLKAYRKPNRPDWLKKVSLILFAPAHMGARLAHLVKEVKFPYLPLGAVYGLVRLYAQVLGDIEENCEHLKELRQETRKCLEDDPLAPLKAACVVHGSDDRVVVLSDFIHDEETKRKDGKGHISVCKPLPSYEDPFSLVMGIRP